jgi:hypothetical protein
MDNWDEFLRQRQREVDELVEKYGYEGVLEALESRGWTKRQDKAGGRPLDYGVSELMDVWHYVADGVSKTGMSVQEFCNRHRFVWLVVGGDKRANQIRGASLRRRFYQAENMLKRLPRIEREALIKLKRGIVLVSERCENR